MSIIEIPSPKSEAHYLASEIKSTLGFPSGLPANGDVEPLLVHATSYSLLYGLSPHAHRQMILFCLDKSLLPDLSTFLSKSKIELDFSKDKFSIDSFCRSLRTFFNKKIPFPVLLSDLFGSQVNISSLSDISNSVEIFARKTCALKSALDNNNAALELYCSRLPPNLRGPSTSFLLQNLDCDRKEFVDFLYNYSASAAQSPPIKSLSTPSSISQSPSSSAPRPSSAPSASFSTDFFCHYCKSSVGHSIDNCPRRKAAEARKAESSLATPLIISSFASAVNPEPPVSKASSLATPFINSSFASAVNPEPPVSKASFSNLGHLVVPVSFQIDRQSTVSSYIAPDSGSPTVNLLRSDIARSMGFSPPPSPGSTSASASASSPLNHVNASVNIAGITRKVNFQIVPENSIQPPAVLSLHDIRAFNLSLDLLKGTASINNAPIPFMDFSTIDPKRYRSSPVDYPFKLQSGVGRPLLSSSSVLFFALSLVFCIATSVILYNIWGSPASPLLFSPRISLFFPVACV